MGAVGRPEEGRGDAAQELEAEQALSNEALKAARARSPLLQTMPGDVELPFAPSVIRRWLAVASGHDVDVDDAVEVLQVRALTNAH